MLRECQRLFFRFSTKILKIKKYHSKKSAGESIEIYFQLAAVHSYYVTIMELMEAGD